MYKIMYKYVQTLAIICMLSQALSAERPTVADLLEKYRANQDRLRSFIAKGTDTTVTTDSANPGRRFKRRVSEFRTDGERMAYQSQLWRDWNPEQEDPQVEQASRYDYLWDGESWINYTKPAGYEGRASLRRNESEKRQAITVAYKGAPLIGMLGSDHETADTILREATTVYLEEQMDEAGGVQYYVISAVTEYGRYKVWIDPQHGYHIARAEVEKTGTDIAWGKPLNFKPRPLPNAYNRMPNPAKESYLFSLKNVRFDKIDDVWIPVEADWESVYKYENGQVVTVRNHHERTEVKLNPDHNALGSFIPDIENGTKVFLNEAPGILYTWQDGKLVPNVDKYVIDEMDKITEEIVTEGVVCPARLTVEKTETSHNKSFTIADTKPETQVDIAEAQQDMQPQSRSFPAPVLIPIGLLISGVIVWLVFRRLKA